MFQSNASKSVMLGSHIRKLFFLHFVQLYSFLMSDLFYVDIDQGIRKGKCNVAQSEKLSGFSYTTKI